SRTTLRAPIDGTVITRNIDPGQTVVSNFQTATLFEIAEDLSSMRVEANVDEADIGRITIGQPVSFSVDAYPGEVFAGEVGQVRKAPTEQQNVVTYLVLLDVDNEDGKLLPGMTATVDIVTGSATDVLRVPTAALRYRPLDAEVPDGEHVFVEGGEGAEALAVSAGLEGDRYSELTDDTLSVGDEVIVRALTATDE
ncbi:MAG: efflux RND transporter periplasmic adaptor subunit, partial [Pacificimonas sp.]